MLRIDVSRADRYLYPEAPKLSFGQKIGRAFGKAVSFLGPIGAAVTAVALPGIGIPLAMGMYGASKLSGDMVNRSYSKEQIALQSQQQKMQGMQITTPGLFEQPSGPQIDADFIAPPQFQTGIQSAIINREQARGSAVQSF